MNPARRAIMWVEELYHIRNDKQLFWTKLDLIAGTLVDENDLEMITRTFMTIARAPELKTQFEHGFNLAHASNFMKLVSKGKFMSYVFKQSEGPNPLTAYTEEEARDLVDQK